MAAAAIAALLAAGGTAYAANQAGNVKTAKPRNAFKDAKRARLLFIQSIFPDLMEQFRVGTYKGGRGGGNPLGGNALAYGLGNAKSGGGSNAKINWTGGKVPKSERVRIGNAIYRVPSFDELNSLASRLEDTAAKQFDTTAQRLESRPLLRDIFRQSRGELGEYGGRLDQSIKQQVDRVLGGLAGSGTLTNPAVVARAIGPLELQRAQMEKQARDTARAQAISLVTGSASAPGATIAPPTLGALFGTAGQEGAFNAQLGLANAGIQNEALGFKASAYGGLGNTLAGLAGTYGYKPPVTNNYYSLLG